MRRRRAIAVIVVGTIVLALLAGAMPRMIAESLPINQPVVSDGEKPEAGAEGAVQTSSPALNALEELAVKGRASKTGYERSQFGSGWSTVNGCSTRDIILYRDLENASLDGACKVASGTLNDPYTGTVIQFTRDQSSVVQIDHVVALSDAWQKGAQALTPEMRKQLANDPLELIAASGAENQAKGDGDAATWLPKNKGFRCEYIARQIAIKKKYTLWVTEPEKQAMAGVLSGCPNEPLPLGG